MFRQASPLRRTLPLLLACLLAGCTAETTDPVVEAGEDLLEAFDPGGDPDAGFASLNRFAAEQADLAAFVAVGLLDAGEADTRYAAVYVLALTAEDEADRSALGDVLDDPETHLRALAAGSLAGAGEAEAIPVLIGLLTAADEIPASDPSVFVDRFASETLTHYTGEDFGSLEARGGEARAQAQRKWLEWWTSVRDTIRWDAATERYVT